jgi:hypothetical protein
MISPVCPRLPLHPSGRIIPMRTLHTIERWDDATGKEPVEEIARVRRFPGCDADLLGGGETLA